MKEQWKKISEFPEYEVSDLGRVRRGDRIKQLRTDHKGYPRVSISRAGKSYTRFVQRLVAEAFIGHRPDGAVVRHIDGIKANVRAANLRYGTAVENEADKIEHGTKLIGERHHQAKLNSEQIFQIRDRFVPRNALNTRLLAAEFNISVRQIYKIVSRKLWADLPQPESTK